LLGGRARGRRSRDNDAFASTRGHGRGASNIRQPRPLLVVQFAIPNCSYPVRQETTIVAYEMNDQPLPHFNGFPARVIVPGWTGTYWMKHVISINAVTEPFTRFWMNSAYSIQLRAFPAGGRFTSRDSAVRRWLRHSNRRDFDRRRGKTSTRCQHARSREP